MTNLKDRLSKLASGWQLYRTDHYNGPNPDYYDGYDTAMNSAGDELADILVSARFEDDRVISALAMLRNAEEHHTKEQLLKLISSAIESLSDSG